MKVITDMFYSVIKMVRTMFPLHLQYCINSLYKGVNFIFEIIYYLIQNVDAWSMGIDLSLLLVGLSYHHHLLKGET